MSQCVWVSSGTKTGEVEINEADKETDLWSCLVSLLIGALCKFLDQNSKLVS